MYQYIIVDDESLIRQGIRKQLEPLGDLVACAGEASNGREAISLIETCSPSIAIIDMQMPIMPGTQLLPYLSQHFPKIQLIVISGYKDFDYIKHALSANAIDYILKPFSRKQIQDVVQKAVKRLENVMAISNQILSTQEQKEQAYYEYDIQMLRSLIMGYHTDSTSISSKQLGFINNTHNFILLTFNSSTSLADTAIQPSLDESGYSDIALFLSHPNNLYLGFVLLFPPEHTLSRSRDLCAQVMEVLSVFLCNNQIHVHFGVSEIHSQLHALAAAYDECCSALNGLLLSNGYEYDCFYRKEPDPQPIVWEKTDEFLFRLEAGMTDQVRALIQELKAYFLSVPTLTLGDVKFYFYNLTSQCWPIMNDYSKQYKPSISMQNVVKSIFSLDELVEYYSQFFTNLTEILKGNNVYAVSDTIEKVKIYIERNYQKNITTELISSYFYLNASYFSHVFRQKTGEKFVDYLNRIRIHKSKELLLTTDRKMYQIARSVGYDNVKYYFRVFKKTEGITPEQYRLRHGND
ncbi:response regulator transcription factor [Enterocloster citroniae]|uniref:response regulator transcription factor n=1 Tax=Enterocloster citroniae TaxID=358743 RepID=UPI001899ACC8|nr:response regulator [Enterocloster citroniae]